MGQVAGAADGVPCDGGNLSGWPMPRTGLTPSQSDQMMGATTNGIGVDKISHRRNSSYCHLQDAKARFSELVRRAAEQGPQHVTVNGEERAVVVSAQEYDRLTGQRTGRELVKLLSESPLADVEFEHPRISGPVRDVEL
jgi:antitoxin Phd